MCLAMMGPAVLPAARHVAMNVFRHSRLPALAAFLCGYLLLWLLLGAAVHTVAAAVGPGTTAAAAVPLLVCAAAWQLTSWKRRALLACPRALPLPPRLVGACRGSALFGWVHGCRCARSSGLLMAAVAVGGHPGTSVMLGLTAFMAAEERADIGSRTLAPGCVALLAWAGVRLLGAGGPLHP